jgi:hypothetical protein
MTQPSRTTESISRDHAGIRDIMNRIRELTVPDRATLAVGLVGHLATLMNRSQMTKLLGELTEQAERVQDVPPARQSDLERRTGETEAAGGRRQDSDDRSSLAARDARTGADERASHPGVGQAGRGEFRSGELL